MFEPSDKNNDCHSPTHNFNSRWQEATVSSPKAQADFIKLIFSRFEGNIPVSKIRLTIPLLKLLTTIIVLSVTEKGCDNVGRLNKWFGLIIVSDVLAVVLKSLVLKNQIAEESVRRSSSNLPDLLQIDGNFQLDDLIGTSSLDGKTGSKYIKITKTKRILNLLWWLKVVFHLGLILYGNILYSHTEPCGNNQGSARMILAVIHLVIGYIYVGVPILFILLVFVWFTGKSLKSHRFFKKLFKKNKNVQHIELDKLKTEKYSGDIEGYPECSICGKQYTKGQDIIRLDCNSTHHFHKSCLKAELKKVSACPLCGVEVTSDRTINLNKITQVQLNNSYIAERVL